jgi:hypothetical protein
MSENVANTEVELAAPELLVPYDDPMQEAMQAERALWRAVLWGTIIAIPICIVIWIAIVALAVGGKNPDWGAWIGIGILVGLLAGAFFGGWAGFTAKAHLLDVVDEKGAHHH